MIEHNKYDSFNNSNIGNANQGCVYEKQKKNDKKIHKKFRAIIFFDGTGNNRANTEARKLYNDLKRSYQQGWLTGELYEKCKAYEKNKSDDNSYQNDYSNVAKLETNFLLPPEGKKENDFDEHFSIYVSGIGTKDLKADVDIPGGAFGRGKTGVKTRVEKAIDFIANEIANATSSTDIIDKIQVDSIGFSRGAAAARYFVHAVLNDTDFMLSKKLQAKNKNVTEVKSGFVGLFDTVASIGTKWLSTHPFSNDTEWLKLDAISVSEKVVHLVAADEYREMFPSTNINSKGSVEIKLPGVHSDIGGGYTDNMNEVNKVVYDLDTIWVTDKEQIKIDYEIDWLVNQTGWYAKNEVEINFWNEISVNRKGIRNTYSRIPLHIMKQYMKDSVLKFNDVDLKTKEWFIAKEHPDLDLLNTILGPLGTGDWTKSLNLLKKIRHKYFHFSSYYDQKDYSNVKQFFGVNSPRLINGLRKREIFNG
ncbi:MAG TPA: DUF2235 domain-containing protein [Panacibacter sp.]|nr:DUF2235 domain-containing protein [Panacibacter sp.]